MTPLSHPVHLEHLRSESARFRAVLGDCDPSARVPACPDWDAADLLWHLAEVQWFWAATIRVRPGTIEDAGLERPPRPTSYADLLTAFDDVSRALVDELGNADPGEAAWHWSPVQTVATTYRRQAHEALIHRLDAEQAAGEVTPIDAALAADGVWEALDLMYGGQPPAWASFTPASTGPVLVEMTDTGDRLWLAVGSIEGTDPAGDRTLQGPHLLVVDDPGGPAAATVRGEAGDLDAWLWHRADGEAVETDGDPTALDAFRAAIAPAIE